MRAAKDVHTFGEPGKFWNSTNIYLSDGRWKWWTMDANLEDTDLINRASTDRVYGAPGRAAHLPRDLHRVRCSRD